jgi:peptide/nickel transport system permease protein
MRRLLLRDAATVFGTVSLVLVLLVVLLGVAFSPYDPIAIDTAQAFLPPSPSHPFGTDELGRDLFTRFADGGLTSLGLAFAIVLIAGTIGWVVGSAAGYLGRVTDTVVMRSSDALQAFPLLLLAMLIAYALGRGTLPVVVALSVAYIPYFVKVARGVALGYRDTNVVRAAKAAGAGRVHIIRTHVMPHVLPTLLTQMTMAVGASLLAIAGLSIIGLGAPAPAPEWGSILAGSTTHVFRAWWYAVIPGVLITLAAVAFNLLGDSVRAEFVSGGRRRRRAPAATGLSDAQGARASA